MSFTKCDTSTKHDAIVEVIRKNTSILRTTRGTNTGLLPALENCWRCPYTKNTANSTVWLKRTMPGQHSVCISQWLWQLQQQKSGVRQQGLGASRCCRKLTELLQRSNREPHPIIITVTKHSCVLILLLTDYNSRIKRERSTKLQTHGEMDPQYQWSVMPTSIHIRLFMVANL